MAEETGRINPLQEMQILSSIIVINIYTYITSLFWMNVMLCNANLYVHKGGLKPHSFHLICVVH